MLHFVLKLPAIKSNRPQKHKHKQTYVMNKRRGNWDTPAAQRPFREPNVWPRLVGYEAKIMLAKRWSIFRNSVDDWTLLPTQNFDK